MQTRKEYAACLRAACDQGLGADCRCAKRIEAGEIIDGLYFAEDFPGLGENQHTIVMEMGSIGLIQSLGLDLILGRSPYDRDFNGAFGMDQYLFDPFAGIEDAEEVSGPEEREAGLNITLFGDDPDDGYGAFDPKAYPHNPFFGIENAEVVEVTIRPFGAFPPPKDKHRLTELKPHELLAVQNGAVITGFDRGRSDNGKRTKGGGSHNKRKGGN